MYECINGIMLFLLFCHCWVFLPNLPFHHVSTHDTKVDTGHSITTNSTPSYDPQAWCSHKRLLPMDWWKTIDRFLSNGKNSAHCYHLQDPSEAHKQLKAKTTIPLSNDSDSSTKKFSHDEKTMTVEEFAESDIDFMEFHRMASEFYLPDPQDSTQLCYILTEDSEYSLSWVVKYFWDYKPV